MLHVRNRECMTDNPARTAKIIREILSKNGYVKRSCVFWSLRIPQFLLIFLTTPIGISPKAPASRLYLSCLIVRVSSAWLHNLGRTSTIFGKPRWKVVRRRSKRWARFTHTISSSHSLVRHLTEGISPFHIQVEREDDSAVQDTSAEENGTAAVANDIEVRLFFPRLF